MVVSLKHTKVSAKADGLDGALVQPTDWNAEHALTMASARMLGRTTAGTGAVEELDAAAVRGFADVGQNGLVVIETENDDAYTFLLTDRGKLIRSTGNDPTTFTIPTNASVAFPVGTRITILQTGSGQVTISPAAGVTLNSISSRRKISARYGEARLYKYDTNSWNLSGDIAA